jgi:hypothetical protein
MSITRKEDFFMKHLCRSEEAWLVQNDLWTNIDNPIEEWGELVDSLLHSGYSDTSGWGIGTDPHCRATVHRAMTNKAPYPYLIVFDYDIAGSFCCFIFVSDVASLLRVCSMIASICSGLVLGEWRRTATRETSLFSREMHQHLSPVNTQPPHLDYGQGSAPTPSGEERFPN